MKGGVKDHPVQHTIFSGWNKTAWLSIWAKEKPVQGKCLWLQSSSAHVQVKALSVSNQPRWKRGPVQGHCGEHCGTCPEHLDVKCFGMPIGLEWTWKTACWSGTCFFSHAITATDTLNVVTTISTFLLYMDLVRMTYWTLKYLWHAKGNL